MTRRDFLKSGLAAAVARALSRWPGNRGLPRHRNRLLPKRLLGRTGARVSMLGLGGQILLEDPAQHDAAVALINRAIDLGITYCDTAHDYYPSEVYYGEVMATRRSEVFLTTKTADRTRDGAWANLEESLTRLQTDHVDLVKVHHLDTTAELDQILQPDGALAALTEARGQGLVRFIGLSSHVADVMLSALDAFDFDTVQCRVNPLDPIRGDFIGTVLPVALSRNLGIIAMKVMDRGGLLDGRATPGTLLRYTLSHPVCVAIIGNGSMSDLESNALACRTFTQMDEAEMQDLEDMYCG
jgi:aryl-alcohol dehydrogenase-like predicted oxidoreductase